MTNNVLIILGMHRSGTSLTAKWLHRCGINLGDRLLHASVSNKDGHFEDLDFHDVHEAIFQNHGIPYGGFDNIHDFKPNNDDFNKIKELVLAKSLKNKQWGWKEPRTCLFMDEYMKLLPNAKILLIVRNYNSVINSLIDRDINKVKRKYQKRFGRLGFLRAFAFTLLKERGVRRYLGARYSSATIIYYKKIIEALKKLDKKNVVVTSVASLASSDDFMLNKLQNWGFSITRVYLKDFFKPQYMTSSKSCPYVPVTERDVLDELQSHIESYIKLK